MVALVGQGTFPGTGQSRFATVRQNLVNFVLGLVAFVVLTWLVKAVLIAWLVQDRKNICRLAFRASMWGIATALVVAVGAKPFVVFLTQYFKSEMLKAKAEVAGQMRAEVNQTLGQTQKALDKSIARAEGAAMGVMNEVEQAGKRVVVRAEDAATGVVAGAKKAGQEVVKEAKLEMATVVNVEPL